MKKALKTLSIVLLICMASVFVLASCGLQEALENADYTEEYTADNRDGCAELINSFFEETMKDPDFVVTNKTDGDTVQYTETVKGTSSHTVYSDGAERFAYKKGEFFYIAAIDREEDDYGDFEETRYYYCSDSSKEGYLADDEYSTMEDMYKGNYCSFLGKYGGVGLVDSLPEEGNTFSCVSRGERKDGVTTGSLEFVFATESGTLKITADSKDNLVQTLRIVVADKSGLNASRDLTWTFAYGGASVTIPDTDAWDREAAAEAKRIEDSEAALAMRDEFFAATLAADNVEATIMDESGKILYVETIVNGIDRLADSDSTSYVYKKEYEDRTDYYYVFDGYRTKYYTIENTSDFYDVMVLMYYSVVNLRDGIIEEPGYSFATEINGNELTFTLYHNDKAFGRAAAVKEGELVTTVTYYDLIEHEDPEDSMTFTCNFVYGKSELSEPDLTGFEDRSGKNDDDDDEDILDFTDLESGDVLFEGTEIAFLFGLDNEELAVIIDNSLVARVALGNSYTVEDNVTVIGVDEDAPALYLTASD